MEARSKSWSECRRPLVTVRHPSDELDELSQWLCHNINVNVNIDRVLFLLVARRKIRTIEFVWYKMQLKLTHVIAKFSTVRPTRIL